MAFPRRPLRVLLAVSLTLAAASPAALAASVPNQGLAMRAEPKYKPGFKAYDYARADAPKGGTLVIGMQGTFDTLNPFQLKGESSLEIESLCFQELADQSLDEPFTQYPTLAETLAVAPDHLSMTVTLRREATFSDGQPVTADDLLFSFETFRTDKVPPFYKMYWEDVRSVQVIDPRTFKMTFAKENPELPLIATQLPVLPRHVYGKGDFGADFTGKAVGSGPYMVKEFHPGASFTLVRNPHFWGKDLPFFRGRYNFDEIIVKYYKDPTAMLEGFKKGDFDVYAVNSAKMWARDLTGDKVETLKYIKKESLPNANDQGAQGFVFNMRLPIFHDVRVRQALALALDFDWSNKNLFYGQYQQNASFFENSPLAAKGLPSAAELAVLEPLKADLPPEVFTKEMGWLGKSKDIKDRLRAAAALLKDAGFTVKDGVAQGPAGKLEFKFLLDDQAFQRVVEPYMQNLRKIGVVATIEMKEPSVYVKSIEARDFAMTVQAIPESQSPGNEQREYWGSVAADQNYSRNYAGIKNKAVDALVDRVIYAKTRDELELASRCLDRALYHLHPLVHNWHAAAHRFAYWDKFGRPAQLPAYYTVRNLYQYMWFDADKAKRLQEAQAKNAPLL